MYNNNPRMIPNQFTPECHKIHITALPKTPNIKDKRKRKNVNKKNEAFNMKEKESKFYINNLILLILLFLSATLYLLK